MTLQEEIQNGESRTLGYKAELPLESQKWIKTLVIFANGAGGKFVLGVHNKRDFVGLAKTIDLFELKDENTAPKHMKYVPSWPQFYLFLTCLSFSCKNME